MQRVMKRLVRIFMTNNMQLRQRSVAGWSIPAGSMVGLWCCLLLGTGSVGSLAQPANDDFANAIEVFGTSGTTNGDTFGATIQAGEPRYLAVGDHSVWYTWVAPDFGRQQVTFEANVPSSDAVVTVYTGSAVNALTPVPLNNVPVASAATITAFGETTYHIAVTAGANPGFFGQFNLNWSLAQPATTNRFAGKFQFSLTDYAVGEYDFIPAPFGPPAPAIPFRSADGAVITVLRVGGSAGRVSVDYRTMDEVPATLFATQIADVTSVTNGPGSYTNRGTFTYFFTNAYTLSSNYTTTFIFPTNWASTTSFCDAGQTNCIKTNVLQNCSPDILLQYGCPGSDYLPTSGTLVFDEFETIKKFVVPVFGNRSIPLTGTRDKQVLLELFNQQLAPEELANPTGILPPLRDKSGSIATLSITESFPLNGGTNFFIERTSYAVDEDGGSVVVDIILPSGAGGGVRVVVVGVENGGYVPSAGSDYAAGAPQSFNEPTYTDGNTGFDSAQDFGPSSTTLTFAVGETRKRITIPILNDTDVEFNEDILVILEGLGGINPPVRGNARALVTILYDEQPAGALDREWNPDDVSYSTPRFNPTPGANNIVRAVGVQADDKTVIAGDFTAFNSVPINRIARILTNGFHDATFNPGTGADDFITSLALYPALGSANDGKIMVGGGFTSMNNIQRNGIARLNTDGSLDTSFDPGLGVNGVVRSVALQSDGKVVIGGEFTRVNGVNRYNVARLNVDGSLDESFESGTGSDGIIWSVAVTETPSRKIFVGGEFLDFNGSYRGNIAALNEDGSLDSSFDPAGGADGPVYIVAAQSDGRLVVGGYFDGIDYVSRPRIARLLSTGALDSTFRPGSGANDAVYSITFQPDGKLMVGGVFTSFNGTRRTGLTRLFVNGTVDTSFLDTAYNHFAGLVNDFGFEAPNYVNSVALQSDGGVMIGGSFHQVGGNFAAQLNNNAAPYLSSFFFSFFDSEYSVWTRADKRPRYNIARLIGGYTVGPGNVGYVLEQNTTDENSGLLTVPLERFDGRLGTISATATTADNLATNGTDFVAGFTNPTWFENSTGGQPISVGEVGESFFLVNITEDSFIEGDELFGLRLTAPVGSLNLSGDIIPLGAALALPEAVATISDNDFSKGVLAFSAATYYTNENVSSMRVTVVRTNGSSGLISVRYYTYNGSALSGSDYTGVTLGTLSFGSGETSKTISIPLSNDNAVELDESFFLVLTNATAGARIYSSDPLGNIATNSVTAQLVIIDNDLASGSGKANFGSATFAAAEASGTAQITVYRLGGSVGQLQVSVTASGGTAANGVDFNGLTNAVVWVNGDVTPKTITVPLLDDSSVEGDETVSLKLVSPIPLGATGSVNTATLTITDDDFYGALSFSQRYFDADERGTNVTITVVRTGGSGGTVSVDYATADDSAVSPTDYLAASGTLTFGPGVIATNFDVTIINNTNRDVEERTLGLTLTGFVNATAGTVAAANLRIVDDEAVGDPAGSLDTTFNPLAGSSNSIFSLVLQPDGKLLAGGDFRTLNRTLRNRVGRLNTNGTLDLSFNALGGPNATVRTMALQDDGRLVIGGFFTSVHSTNRNRIARLLADGTLDRFFNPGAGADNPVYSVAICPDGRIAVGGAFTTMNGISRPGIALLETNGTVSTTFNPGLGAAGTVFAVAVQTDGKILIGGDFDSVNGISRPRLARLNRDGSVDTTFDVGTGPNALVRAITLQSDGKILIGGSFTNVNGTARGHLARLTSAGAIDSSFMTAVVGGDGDVNAIALQFDGKIIVAGEFARFNDVSRSGITRLYRNGKSDPSINFGQGANDAVSTVVVQTDRKMAIGGRFTTFDGQPRAYIARIHGGSIAGSGELEFITPYFEVVENGVEAVISVQRRGGTTGDVTVEYQTLSDTALDGLDFTAVSGTLTFLEAETFQSFTVPILDDSIDESTELAALVLTNATDGAVLGAVPTANLSIISDESGIGFSSSTYTVNEGAAVSSVLITVTRTGATTGTATVGYRTENGTATAGQDYAAQAGLLTFTPGVTSQSFTVAVVDDTIIEGRETFSLSLSNVAGGSALSITTATVTIVDNDFGAGNLTFAATNYSVGETSGTVEVTIVRTNGSAGVLTVDYATVNGTALGTNDFVTQTGTLTFVEGQTNQTIALTILDDVLVEGDESFTLQLLNPGSGTVVSGLTNLPVTIVDNDVSVIIPAGHSLLAESLTSNGIIDPGETVTFSFALRNIGSGNTTNLVATLLPIFGVVSPSAPQSYGVLVANGAAESRTFSFTASGVVGDRIVATLQLSDGSVASFAYTVGGQATRTFSNSSPIVISDDSPASPYPSTVQVTNLGGTITRLTVTMTNFSHAWPNDVDVLLVGPAGQRVMLMSDAGTNQAVSNLAMTFSDSATTPLPLLTKLQSTTYLPANYAAPGLNTSDRFPLPAPQPVPVTDPFPYTNTALAVFNSTSPNGTWSLYVMDDTSGQVGSIGGWSLNIQTSDPVTPASGVSVADLKLTASVPSVTVVVGANSTTTLTVTNRGPAAALNAALLDQMAPGLTLVSATPSMGSWNKIQNTLTWMIGTLPSGGSASITLVTRPQTIGSFTSVATVSANQTDLNPANNTVTLSTTGVSVPALTISRLNNVLSLSWPANSGFKLQVADTLVPANWGDVGTAPQVNGSGQNVVSVGVAGNSKFYRLRAP